MNFDEQLAYIFSNINELIVPLSKSSNVAKNLFDKTAKAALVKSYEFNCIIHKCIEEDTFFLVSSLRGMCEDFIVLKYIFDEHQRDKDQVIDIMLQKDIYTSSIAQWKFFERYHPNQILYYKANFPEKEREYTNKLRVLIKSDKRKGKQVLPSILDMANKSGLSEMYSYIYHATSILVHFNPHVLLRMGWGDLPEITFSTKHFTAYYNHFACFYGAYLFKELCAWMVHIDLLDKAVEADLQKISDLLVNETRWPEIVTFEEMNIGIFSKHLFYESPSSSKNDVDSPRM